MMVYEKSGRKEKSLRGICIFGKLGGTAKSVFVPSLGERLFFIAHHVPSKFKKKGMMIMSKVPYKIYLEESEMPKQWFNVRAAMKAGTFINPEPWNLVPPTTCGLFSATH